MTQHFTQRATVVLVRPQGAINVGLICRVCANLGVDDLRIVAPECDIASEEARMFAHHAQPLLGRVQPFASLSKAVEDCDFVIGTSARMRRQKLDSIGTGELADTIITRSQGRFALVFGNEATGLSNDELLNCHAVLSLETPGTYPSYNLSHAVAIVLYTLLAQPTANQRVNRAATQNEVHTLYEFWLAALERAQYFRRTSRERFAPKLKRLLLRLQLNPHDVKTLRGMLVHFDTTIQNLTR